jgi:hypothetical protein
MTAVQICQMKRSHNKQRKTHGKLLLLLLWLLRTLRPKLENGASALIHQTHPRREHPTAVEFIDPALLEFRKVLPTKGLPSLLDHDGAQPHLLNEKTVV